MKQKYSLLLLVCFLLPATLKGQVDFDAYKNNTTQSFDKFKKNQTQQFENYKQKTQLEFASFLEESWKKFEAYSGKERPRMVKPVELPVADPNDTVPVVKIPVAPDVVTIPKDIPLPVPDLPVVPDNVDYDQAKVVFLGNNLKIDYDQSFHISLPQVTEAKVAEQWKKFANGSFDELIYQCLLVKKELRLNDWAYYLFVKNLADAIYQTNQTNEKVFFTSFVMSNSGYKIRMGRDENNATLFLLLAIADEIYSQPYYVFSGKRYYLIDIKTDKPIYVYDEWTDDGQKKAVSLTLKEPIRTAHQTKTEIIQSSVFNTDLAVEYNLYMKDFYEQMPLCNLSVFFNSECSEEVSGSLKGIEQYLEGKTKTEQVSMLLSFIHQGFPYMTDGNQFGREKFFFYEENFAYPYTDCEDNSILFAYLVRKLTGQKVVGLSYPNHVATAVKFDGDVDVDGSFVMHKGEKYIICDPTYLGSRIGQCMPDYLNVQAQIIEIQ